MSFDYYKENKIIIAALITIVICMADLLMPLWYDVWVLYLLPMFLVFQAAKRPYVYSAIVTLLIAFGLFIPSSDNTPLMHAAANRVTGIFGGWGVSILLMHLKRLQTSQIQFNNELEKRIEERTTQLFQINISLKKEIDERIQADEALRESEERFRSLSNASLEGIMIHDQGVILDANVAFARLFGYEQPEELIGKNGIELLLTPDARSRIYQRIQRQEKGVLEVTGVRKDGAMFVMETESQPAKYFGHDVRIVSCHDITERKRAEEEIRMLKHSIDVHYDGAYWMDSDNKFVYVNDAGCKALGYEREELIGKTLYEVNPMASAEGMKEVWAGLRQGGSFSSESVHRRKDGSEFPVEIVSTYVHFGGKEYACGFARDITDRKKLEEQLRQSHKMESIGTLAGGVAHDFNNILAAIVGYGNIMQMKMRTDDPLRGYLSQILASAERAASLTQSLLAFSRKQVISPRNIDLNESIRKVEKFLTRTIGEDIVLSTSLINEALMIFVDPSQIEQVLMNLATNSRDAMPKGGRLMLETGRAILDDEYVRSHGFGLPGSYAVLTVSDTGEGMDEQTKQKIFDPFFTTKEFGRGTGLGLAIVYGIVKQNNGYINVYSEVGKGTTFKIYLPFVGSRAEESKNLDVQPPLRGGTETILLAEDNESVRLLNRGVLQEFGYTVIDVADGDEALEKFREHRDRINLCILDVIMPKKNGREVFEEATRGNPNVKVIFTSGYPADLIQKEGVLEEGLHFLSKPSSPQALLRMVREVLDQ